MTHDFDHLTSSLSVKQNGNRCVNCFSAVWNKEEGRNVSQIRIIVERRHEMTAVSKAVEALLHLSIISLV